MPGIRPYSDPGQLGGNAPRSGEFTTGTTGDPGNTASSLGQDPGLTLNGLQFMSKVPSGFRPSSVQTPLNYSANPGGNGLSADQAARRLPDGTPLGNINATSESSFEPAAMLRLNGVNSI